MDKAKDYSELSPSWRGYIDALKEDVQAAERRATDAESEVLALRQLDTKSAIELMAAKRRAEAAEAIATIECYMQAAAARALPAGTSVCACRFDEDGETLLSRCAAHQLDRLRAREQEREACAKVAECIEEDAGDAIAAGIRVRSEGGRVPRYNRAASRARKSAGN